MDEAILTQAEIDRIAELLPGTAKRLSTENASGAWARGTIARLLTTLRAEQARSAGLEQALGDILPLVLGASCQYSWHEKADNMQHCCDWNEHVERIAPLVGVVLDRPMEAPATTEGAG